MFYGSKYPISDPLTRRSENNYVFCYSKYALYTPSMLVAYMLDVSFENLCDVTCLE